MAPPPPSEASARSPSAPDDDGDATRYADRILKGGGSVFSGSMVAKAVGFALQIVLGRSFGKAL